MFESRVLASSSRSHHLETILKQGMAEKVVQWETAQDGLDNLHLAEAPMPEPGTNEVLVRINTVSLNYRDTEGINVFNSVY